MLFRGFRVIDTGQWINALFSVDGDEFSVQATSHRDDIAGALGVTPTSLEVVDSAADPRTGTLLEVPIASHVKSADEQAFEASTDAEKIDILAKQLGLA